jgi:hypothetical protein
LALIGGCGSSGTTLLAHVLSRHSKIASAPDIDFFNHPEVLNLAELRAHLDALYRRDRLSSGYKLVADFLHCGDELGLGRSEFVAMLDAAENEADLFRRVALHLREPTGAACFVEQTPSNVYLFRDFSERFPELPLIHQIRDGRDVASSFLRRGKSLYYAGSRWLYDTLAGLRVRGGRSYLELTYERLVTDPEGTLARIVEHVGLPYEDAMVVKPRPDSETVRESNGEEDFAAESPANAKSYDENWRDRRAPKNWTHVPDEPISSSSVGRFKKDLTASQLSTLYRIRLTESARRELDAPVSTFVELLECLGYETADPQPAAVTVDLRLREKLGELSDGVVRSVRSFKRARRPAVPLTTVGAKFSSKDSGG